VDFPNGSTITGGISSNASEYGRPKSYKYLTEQLNAYDFKGYMKVGLNSFPNMFPLLTGENSADHPLATYLREYLDNQPFLWYEKAMARYSTLWSEDRPHISTFIFNKGGFKKSPVDYYYRPYSLALDEIPPVIVDPLGKSTLHCYGNEDHYNLQIEYFKTFVKKYTTILEVFVKHGISKQNLSPKI
jgi:hypothetical protein